MRTMHWYNPTTRDDEDVSVPMSEGQAIEMLSGHPDSDWFIEEYRRIRPRHPGFVETLIFTGKKFRWDHWRGQPPG